MAVFDAGLITFTDQGSILSSPQLLDDGRPKLGVTGKLRVLPSAETKKYLRYHRENIFRVLPHTDP
jgi:putative restriction endonuclease